MPRRYIISLSRSYREAAAARDSGVRAVILFGLPETKTKLASGAYAENGVCNSNPIDSQGGARSRHHGGHVLV